MCLIIIWHITSLELHYILYIFRSVDIGLECSIKIANCPAFVINYTHNLYTGLKPTCTSDNTIQNEINSGLPDKYPLLIDLIESRIL